MRYPDHHKKAKEPPRKLPAAEQEPQDPSLSEHITCLLARQSWKPPKLPLNTPVVTKDVHEFTTEEQQVAREKYVSLLANDLESSLRLTCSVRSLLALQLWLSRFRYTTSRNCYPGQPVSMPCVSLRLLTLISRWKIFAPLCWWWHYDL